HSPAPAKPRKPRPDREPHWVRAMRSRSGRLASTPPPISSSHGRSAVSSSDGAPCAPTPGVSSAKSWKTRSPARATEVRFPSTTDRWLTGRRPNPSRLSTSSTITALCAFLTRIPPKTLPRIGPCGPAGVWSTPYAGGVADPASYRPASGEIPELPGVYRFHDESGRVVYVGKAKNL